MDMNDAFHMPVCSRHDESRRSRVVSVRDTETFYSVVSTLAERGVHRVCVVNEIGVLQEVIEDTEQDPSKVCYKVIHKECQYSAV
ncbi:hypothetical protein Q1695_000996 [Nippostrongylus brasiliensis]|nr:hypothetical protein Q1695_000996 [Nippostrongylus brasiliensis]